MVIGECIMPSKNNKQIAVSRLGKTHVFDDKYTEKIYDSRITYVATTSDGSVEISLWEAGLTGTSDEYAPHGITLTLPLSTFRYHRGIVWGSEDKDIGQADVSILIHSHLNRGKYQKNPIMVSINAHATMREILERLDYYGIEYELTIGMYRIDRVVVKLNATITNDESR
jgi:hypothetical protein